MFTISRILTLEILAIVCLAIIIYIKKSQKDSRRIDRVLHNSKKSSDLDVVVYKLLFRKKKPEELMAKIGLDAEVYKKQCDIVNKKPEYYKPVVYFVYGIFFLVLGIVAIPVFGLLVGGILIFFAYVLYRYPTSQLDKEAKAKKEKISQELPRFLDVLQAELEVGIPAEQAIALTSKYSDGLLAQEFTKVLNNVSVGLHSWQDALEEMAKLYEIEALSDFILDITTSSQKGVNIAKSTKDKAAAIKETAILKIKDEAEKIQSLIVIPTMAFKIIPMVVFLIIPAVVQLNI